MVESVTETNNTQVSASNKINGFIFISYELLNIVQF